MKPATMPAMGRRRTSNPLGLAPRVYAKHGAFYYVHPPLPGVAARWERLGTDVADANRKAAVYNDPGNAFGTMAWWLDRFLLHCQARVAAGTLAPRTLADYQAAVGTADAPGPLRVYFAPPMTPEAITPHMVQDYLDIGAQSGRPVPANREKAALSSCISWLIRTGQVPGLTVNVCMRASGIKRNPEAKRERYVTHAEYRDVWAVAPASVRLLMGLTYRTLQRPESDIIGWTPANIVREGGKRYIRHTQNKTGTLLRIDLSDELDTLIRQAMGTVPVLHQPIIHNRKGQAYTYTGLMSMLTRSIAAANRARKAQGIEPMPAFGFRDLKGKGATDMWQAGIPIEQIQLLCGYADTATTEKYIKARWREVAQANMVVMG